MKRGKRKKKGRGTGCRRRRQRERKRESERIQKMPNTLKHNHTQAKRNANKKNSLILNVHMWECMDEWMSLYIYVR
uniref:Uncharacterized protein n=2 Tax=Anguilla anguilla TaxID=7936 RepID=A0A0E9PS08_ANGAN